MPRPFKPRAVRHDPAVDYFKPAGVPMRDLQEVALGLDEVEALRLADLENLSHEAVGEMMNVSRATAGRILATARRKTAEALVHGWAIRIDRGPTTPTTTPPDDDAGFQRGRRGMGGPGHGRGRGRGRGRI